MNNQEKFYGELNNGGTMKQQKFLIKKRHKNFGGISEEKVKNIRKMQNDFKISRGTWNTKRNKKKQKLHQKRLTTNEGKCQIRKHLVLTLFNDSG